MAEVRTPSQCDGCGQFDDHPKIHYAGVGMETADTYHHDCLPYNIEQALLGGKGYNEDTEILRSIIETAKKGTHGPRLLAHIEKLHEGVNVDG